MSPIGGPTLPPRQQIYRFILTMDWTQMKAFEALALPHVDITGKDHKLP